MIVVMLFHPLSLPALSGVQIYGGAPPATDPDAARGWWSRTLELDMPAGRVRRELVAERRPRFPHSSLGSAFQASSPSRTIKGSIANAATGSAHHQPSPVFRPRPRSVVAELHSQPPPEHHAARHLDDGVDPKSRQRYGAGGETGGDRYYALERVVTDRHALEGDASAKQSDAIH